MSGKRMTAGILGGMGPEATVDLMQKIIRHTVARVDADHVRCLVDQNPQVPSRIKYLMEGGEAGGNASPGPCLAEMARGLEQSGADFLCMACNTAHYWFDEAQNAVQIPILSIVEVAARAARDRLAPDHAGKKVGILATPCTCQAGVYEAPLARHSLEALYADDERQQINLEVINAIKAGETGEKERQKFNAVARHLEERGANAIILGCTELGIIGVETDLPVIDAADALALAIVRVSGASPRE